MGAGAEVFPRSKERGFIEASGGAQIQVPPSHFPRSKERGFIEAPVQVVVVGHLVFFPRSKERGFIEAQQNLWKWLKVLSFRVQKNAASLKRNLMANPRLKYLYFPRSKERGFIEAPARR